MSKHYKLQLALNLPSTFPSSHTNYIYISRKFLRHTKAANLLCYLLHLQGLNNTSLSISQMGNYVSCTLSTSPGKHSRGAKVIFPGGEVREFNEPIKAAELMFEIPNFFLVNSRSLQIGRRFSALNADEDLELGNVYVMFPMKRVNSVVTAADMGALLITANSAAKRGMGAKVRTLLEAPVSSADNSCRESEVGLPRLNLDAIEEFSVPEFKHRLSMCRAKKPLLETIIEEPVYLR